MNTIEHTIEQLIWLRNKLLARIAGGCAVGWQHELTCFTLDGSEKWKTCNKNLVPDAGRDYFFNAALASGQQYPAFYLGLGGTDRVPEYTDTSATLSSYGELIQWTAGTRILWSSSPVSGGSGTNASSPALFVSSALVPQTVRTVFMVSAQPFGSFSGLLISAAMLPSPKIVDPGETLKVVSTFSVSNRP